MPRKATKAAGNMPPKQAEAEPKKFLRVDDIAELLQCSQSHAYKIMRELNNELKKKGKIVVAGRVPRRYIEERLY